MSVLKGIILLMSLVLLTGCKTGAGRQQVSDKPNILIILADDMGFSDLGFMGSGIHTPNLDALAENGLVYSHFYNTARCCPTRASLLTGLYPHQTGMGWMTASDLGYPGYTGDLNLECITVAEALDKSEYNCYMTGKWHLTHERYIHPDGPRHSWPLQRGFNKFYGHLSGGGSYFHPGDLIDDNQWLEIPDDSYLTSAVSDSAAAFLEDHFEKGRGPFFFYLSYYAPHRPLHALQGDVAKYRGSFLKGWDRYREEKYNQQVELGIAGPGWALSGRDPEIAAWETLSDEEKRLWDARMAVYAAMIDRMDQGIGKVLDVLRKNDA
ncbi:MAG TPA: arylsulfatase, partial [Bacteroides sp.]|nr:arylsulfatase [Bacteroides sp.]